MAAIVAFMVIMLTEYDLHCCRHLSCGKATRWQQELPRLATLYTANKVQFLRHCKENQVAIAY